MTKLILILTLALTTAATLLATAAIAGSGYNQCSGEMCWGSDNKGHQWDSQTFGDRENNTTFYHDNRGERCTQQCFAGNCFTNCD